MASKGYIKIWRKVWDDPIFNSRRVFSKFEAWVDLIMLAAGKDKDVIFDSNLISLKRGQVLTSQNRLSKRWGWSRNKVKKFLLLLMSEGRPKIGLKVDRKKTIISIINYNKYNPLGTTEGQLKDNRRTTEGQHLMKDIKKDVMNDKEMPEKKNPGKEKKPAEEQFRKEFKEFWDYYDYKVSRQDAFKAFKALRRKGVEFEIIMKAAKGYMGFLKHKRIRDGFEQQQKYPAGFLRNEYWKDYVDFQYRPPM